MILIEKFISDIQKFLDVHVSSGLIKKYKIFKRIDFQLDVYIFATNTEKADSLKETFLAEKENKGIDLAFYICETEDLEDPYYAAMLEDENIVDNGPRLRFGSFLDSKPVVTEQHDQIQIPIITFYSYKGGMGRTTTTMAYAMHLAENHGKKVVVIDCDLEAPGYLNFFDLAKNDELLSGEKNGFVEFACDLLFAGNREAININNYVVKGYTAGEDLGISDSDSNRGSVWVIPAGNLNEHVLKDGTSDIHRKSYLEGLAKLNLSNTPMIIHVFQELITKVQEAENIKADVVLIDSRTGFNDIFGTAVLNLSKSVVGFFGRSRQTSPGFMNLLQMHRKQIDENHPHGKFKLHIVYSILPQGVKGGSPEMKAFITQLYKDVDTPDENTVNRQDLLEFIGTGDQEIEDDFKKAIRNLSWSDELSNYNSLFSSLDEDVLFRIGVNVISSARREILKRLKDNIIPNFEKQIDFRECYSNLFDKNKFMLLGSEDEAITPLYEALSNTKNREKLVAEYKKRNSNDHFHYIFFNISFSTSDAAAFKELADWSDEDAVYAFWQEFIWKKLTGKEKGSPEQIEKDLVSYDSKLQINHQCLVLTFSGIENLRSLDIEVLNPLLHYWKLNNSAFDNIFPKILLKTNASHFFYLSGIYSNFIDTKHDSSFGAFLDWKIDELLETLGTAVSEGRSDYEDFLFGKKVLVDKDDISLGKPRDYFEKLYSSGSSSRILIKPFMSMLNRSIDECIKEGPRDGDCILPSRIYASKELVHDISEQYIRQNNKHSSAIDSLHRHLEKNPKFKKRSLRNQDFEEIINAIVRIEDPHSDNSDLYAHAEHLESSLLESGIIERIKLGKKYIYCFAPFICELWNIKEN